MTTAYGPKALTLERLRALLNYDPATGVFTWARPRKRTTVGAVAGTPTTRGVTRIGIDGWTYTAGRLAWFYVHGTWPVGTLEHLDGNSANDALDNLRDTGADRPVEARASTPGVAYRPGRNGQYQAQAWFSGRLHYLGLYESEAAAAEAVETFKKEHPIER